MATIISEPSRTFAEYLLLPRLTKKGCNPDQVSLRSPLVRHRLGETPAMSLNVPFVSAIMQSVSDHNMAIALARCGGLSFVYQSQPMASQADMVGRVKRFKAGFVRSDSNISPEATLRDVLALAKRTGHTTMAVTDDGSATGRLMGVLTGRDYRVDHQELSTPVGQLMTPFESLVCGHEGIGLSEANDLIWKHRLNSLPIIDDQNHLSYLVFRQDYEEHRENPNELVDDEKRLMVGAGINTHDYRQRVPVLVEAGADVLCIDSSDGYSEWQRDTIRFVKDTYGDSVRIGAGNVVDGEAFRYLAEAGADFVKVGIGGGSICITREQKGIGRGQASAIIDVAQARDDLAEETGEYVPICSDGGIVFDYHITLALAMGADFVMMGRYFARFDESPAKRLRVGGNIVKEYWGEGSNRARNWQRYDYDEVEEGERGLAFEEGVDVYIPYAGKLKDNVDITLKKIRSTICNCGASTIRQFREQAKLTAVSSTSLREGGAHDVMVKESELGSQAQ
jgi:IMP dehydrogenase